MQTFVLHIKLQIKHFDVKKHTQRNSLPAGTSATGKKATPAYVVRRVSCQSHLLYTLAYVKKRSWRTTWGLRVVATTLIACLYCYR